MEKFITHEGKTYVIEVEPKIVPEQVQGRLLIGVNVYKEDLEKGLNIKFKKEPGEKYSESIFLKFKDAFYRLYCVYDTPRLGTQIPIGAYISKAAYEANGFFLAKVLEELNK